MLQRGDWGVVSKGMYFYQEVGRMGNQEEMLKLSESSRGKGPSPPLFLREQGGARDIPTLSCGLWRGGLGGSSGPGENEGGISVMVSQLLVSCHWPNPPGSQRPRELGLAFKGT